MEYTIKLNKIDDVEQIKNAFWDANVKGLSNAAMGTFAMLMTFAMKGADNLTITNERNVSALRKSGYIRYRNGEWWFEPHLKAKVA